MEEQERPSRFMTRLNRILIRYLTIEVGYLILVGLTCLVLWLCLDSVKQLLKSHDVSWYSVRDKIALGMSLPMLVAYFGNLVGALLSLIMFWTARPADLRFGELVGHVLNFVLVASWGVVYLLLVVILSMEGGF